MLQGTEQDQLLAFWMAGQECLCLNQLTASNCFFIVT